MSEWAVPVSYALIALLTFRQYGITLDESRQMRYGELVLQFFRSGFTGSGGADFGDLRFYGPLFEMIAAATWQIAPSLKFDLHHLAIAVTGLLTIIATGRYAKSVNAEPFLAQLALVALPQFYGHSFNNSKDIPLACAMTWAFVALATLQERARPASIMSVGLAAGATLAIRAGSAPLLLLAFLVVIATAEHRKETALRVASATPIAWAVMIAFWPWALQNPILNPLSAIRVATHFARPLPVLFEGVYLPSTALPRRYLAEMLAITTPLPLLVLAIIGIILAARQVRRGPEALLLTWILAPLVAFIVLRPVVYDGVRHFLFMMPPIAISAAVAATTTIRRWPRPLVLVTVALAIAASFVPMWRLHPYEMTYYNALVGGTRGAARRFHTDYWTSSYREAALWIREHPCRSRPTRVLVAANDYWIDCVRAYLPPGEFIVTGRLVLGPVPQLPPSFDYYVGTTRWGFAGTYYATPIVHTVGRAGAVFTVIRGSKHDC